MRPAQRLGDHAALIAWAAGVVAVLTTGLAGALAAAGDQPVPWKPLLLTLLWVAPGVLISAARPRLPVGWLMLAVALLFVGSGLAEAWLAGVGADAPGAAWVVWFVDRFAAFLVPCALLAVVLLPDGRAPSRAWRPLLGVVVGAQVAVIACFCLVDGPAANPDSALPARFAELANPVGVLPPSWADLVAGLDLLVLQLPMLLIPVALGHRLLRAEPAERQRLVVLLLGAGVFAILLIVGHLAWPSVSDALDVLASLLLVVVVVGTVLGPRREVDWVVHHAVVFVVLTLLIAGAYVAATAAISARGAELPPWGAGTVAAVVALLLLPLRGRLQRLVHRLVYGDRHDPHAALTRLAESTHHLATTDDAVAEIAASVATALRVPYVRVTVGDREASSGRPPARADEHRAPLRSGAQVLGEVLVAADPTRRWHADDEALLRSLGRHGGMVVRAMTLADTLRASRQRLVETREEERRLVGRDLHDNLGPTLASISMQLGSLRAAQPPGSEEEARLRRLEDAAREALGDLRRLARELRPTSLDQHGLVRALERDAAEVGLDLTVRDAAELPPLPAAVEVAAYRIGQQALGNVAAHAGVAAATLTVRVETDAVHLEVADAGAGFAEVEEGVGLSSMRERAEELGGTCAVRSGPDGTVVTATIPLSRTGAEVGR